MTERSIVEYFSGNEGYRCGYCKSENTCYSHGMWAHILTPIDYQNLIDRGWRRSGKYCYKPTLQQTCCPQYTIRCEAKKFTVSKSQKKVLKKVHKFLANGEKEKRCSSQSSDVDGQVMDVTECPEAANIKNIKEIKPCDIETSNISSLTCLQSEQTHEMQNSDPSSNLSSNADSSHTDVGMKDTSKKPSILDPNRAPCRKAKEIRRQRKLQKLLNKGLPAQEAELLTKKQNNQPKSLEDFLFEPSSEPAYRLKLRLVPSSLENSSFKQTFQESYSIYKKYQMTIHKDPDDKCSQRQFIRFLVNNPFQDVEEITSSQRIYGSFHQQYWLNDSLIAVGVIDILPYCVSSVYFYYDPDYSFLSLGTYAALREIQFVRELNVNYPDIQYYYMGFYIHSCVKMRYKGQFVPSYLLCPETYIFQPIEKCKPKLDIFKYQRFEEDSTKGDQDGIVNLSKVLILYNKTQMTFPVYSGFKKGSSDEEVVREYAKFVGRKCYKRMLLYRS